MLILLFVLCLPGGKASENFTGYDPSELLSQIFNSNDTQLRGGYGLINFDQNYHSYDPNGYIPNPVVFGDGLQGTKKKRRRKPKKTLHQYAGGYINNGDSFYNRPVPRPSLAAQAFSSVTEALTSIAQYDDYQCVPRLLCEASGGVKGLPAVPGLEPLLTLLSAYTGITTNPLFVFGRAVYLGMSSPGNPAACRYAYPQCPTDAEKLVHYLNNHNGGFFRFFNSPQQQQNLEQFYQHYPPPAYDQNVQNPGPQNAGQYGFYKPNLYGNQQQYGSAYNYKTSKIQKRIQNRPNFNTVDETDEAKFTFPDGSRDFDDDGFYIDDEDINSNFKFPESNKNDRKTRGFAFPSNGKLTYNKPNNNKFLFSDQNNVYYDRENVQDYKKYVKQQNKYQEYKYGTDQNYHRDVSNNYYNREVPVNNYNNYNNNNYEDVQTVYVVRGNGDPNRPEIIKLKPGQSVKDF